MQRLVPGRLSPLPALFAVLFTASLAGAAPPASHAPLPSSVALPTETVLLPNGLHLLLAPDPKARLVSVHVSYDAGTGDDPAGLRGLAHLTEHLVADRTKHVPSGLRMLESWGASAFNATTSLDTTSYFETVPPERLEDVLWLESDRMGFAADAVTEERLAVARAAVKNEGREREWDASGGSLLPRIHPELFPIGHPYANASAWHDADAVRGGRRPGVPGDLVRPVERDGGDCRPFRSRRDPRCGDALLRVAPFAAATRTASGPRAPRAQRAARISRRHRPEPSGRRLGDARVRRKG